MEEYYFVNNAKTISKREWRHSRKDWERWSSDNYFISYNDALNYLKALATKSNKKPTNYEN